MCPEVRLGSVGEVQRERKAEHKIITEIWLGYEESRPPAVNTRAQEQGSVWLVTVERKHTHRRIEAIA